MQFEYSRGTPNNSTDSFNNIEIALRVCVFLLFFLLIKSFWKYRIAEMLMQTNRTNYEPNRIESRAFMNLFCYRNFHITMC